jgi:energy-coupling factor transport system ATP-binding protein
MGGTKDGGLLLEARDIRFSYKGAANETLCGASLVVAPGEVVALVGENGCGKSTLARALCGSLRASAGEASVDGLTVGEPASYGLVGYVRQDPKSQLVAPVVFDEVAFGPCNIGLLPGEVRERVAKALETCGLAVFESRSTDALSGGEMQLVALAGVLAMKPRYLVLDEVTSMLDGVARARVRELVRRLADGGMGVLLVTHDAEDVLAANKAVAMDAGRVVWEGAPQEVVVMDAGCTARKDELGGAIVIDSGREAQKDASQEVFAACRSANAWRAEASPANERGCLRTDGVSIAYDGRAVLDGVSLRAKPGCVTLLVGPSGSGKTTLARVLAGVAAPDAGRTVLGNREVRAGDVGLGFQRPEAQMIAPTVVADVALGPRNLGASQGRAHEVAAAALARVGVARELWGRSPFALSGGEARMAALAGVVAMGQAALILDEPTAGLDAAASSKVRSLARELADEGKSVLVITHDVAEWLEVADEVTQLEAGRIVWHGKACELPGIFELSSWRIRSFAERGERA